MNIVDFENKHIEEARDIALENYNEERQFVKELPETADIPDLSPFSENGLGVAAFENGKMVGFLCCYNPWDNAFGSAAKGTFSPIHAHGTIFDNREMIYHRLYQAAAEKWVKNHITYHGISLYAHDEKALRAFFLYGFGVRCCDAIRRTDSIGCNALNELSFGKLSAEEIPSVREMRKMLSAHMGESPCFMYSDEKEFQSWLESAEKRKSDIYTAQINGKLVSFIELGNDGENFITETENMKNICGAFCLPEYRGKDVFASLLNYTLNCLNIRGTELLGVDYESFNPTALGAWEKYFTPYTRSVVRRIDEGVLKKYVK